MAWLRRVLVVVLVGGVMYTGWQLVNANAAPVSVNYVFGEFEQIAQWQALLAAFAIGFALAGVALLYHAVKSWLVQRRYRQQIAGLEAEIHQLRNLPLVGSEPSLPGGASHATDGHTVAAFEPADRGA